MAGSYYWIVGQGAVGESKIWDGISPIDTNTHMVTAKVSIYGRYSVFKLCCILVLFLIRIR